MIITKRGEQIGEITDLAQVGQAALDFEVTNLDNKQVTLKDYAGKKVLVSVFPDINTSVCDTQTRHFFEEASKHEDLTIVNLSNNTVEELANWCATAGIEVDMLSDANHSFADAYGLLISGVDLLERSVFVIDRDGQLVYKEVLSEITAEPDYDAVLAAADALN